MRDATLGQRIAERRKLLGLSQEAFGDKMGVSRQAISKWEADAATPEIEKLITMSKLFGVSVGWLLGTEEAIHEDELSAQIRMTFQPPQPEPGPVAAPEAAQESAPAPANPRWPRIVFACALLLSLLLSLIAVYLSGREPQTAVSDTTSTDRVRIEELESQLAKLQKQLNDVDLNCDILSNTYYNDYVSVLREFEELARLIGSGTEIPQPPEELPTYTNIEKWSLTGEAAADLSKVTVALNATASTDIRSAQFRVLKNGKEVYSTACALAGRKIHATTELDAADGYEYLLTLTHRDGTAQQIELSGHTLADLTVLASPQLRFTRRELKRFGPDCFTQGFFSIHLEVPYLTSPDAQRQWSDLRISYYHNEGLVEEVDLMSQIDEQDLLCTELSFRVDSHTYQMYYTQENDIHDLRLEGSLTIDGVENKFSLPLLGWVIKNGEFVQITG